MKNDIWKLIFHFLLSWPDFKTMFSAFWWHIFFALCPTTMRNERKVQKVRSVTAFVTSCKLKITFLSALVPAEYKKSFVVHITCYSCELIVHSSFPILTFQNQSSGFDFEEQIFPGEISTSDFIFQIFLTDLNLTCCCGFRFFHVTKHK